MEDKCGVSDESSEMSRSEFKVLAGEKRARPEKEERSEFDPKRAKMRDLDAVFRSEEKTAKEAVHPVNSAIDLNSNLHVNTSTSRGFGLDLNAEDNADNGIFDSDPCKDFGRAKSFDDSDCGSSIGPLEDKDPMKVWKEMKQNGFLSSSHGGVPMPKQHGRKSKIDGIKRKMELARKEQVDRFAKMAAPSGLLNDLNPGIINHVRNKKQVHSIIEALVKSEKNENLHSGIKQGDQIKRGTIEYSERTDLQITNRSDLGLHSFFREASSMAPFIDRMQTGGYSASVNNSISFRSQLTGVDNESFLVDRRGFGGTRAHLNLESEDDILALKLSSAMPSDNASSLSNEESANLTSVDSLSVKAASVASQWLELLHLDIKGRLAALRRSKKRVRAVIQTELPFLFSKEFPLTQEIPKPEDAACPPNSADAHRAKWKFLFDQMDKTLVEEEKQMESWLNQVREMQLHCEKGLSKYSSAYALQHPFENDNSLPKADSTERDLAVRAAAASIYSTCNFLLSNENLPCC
ncbi:OLC1v1026977C1 [Oldenlandia corymbosa var. corymbosa]|uniref:OLC1v1026977C1 n=1 Tax=Oldenlandia corymbosa var. corymbosa TaxID=529605 RepID=A0AAV1CAL7_OLDCO|nr:OLC1v1026977C1 [Oldenlandia corymbosa var. corymbosa]